MGQRYLIDSDILIYYLTDQFSEQVLPLVESLLKDSFRISILSKIEVLGWRGHTQKGFKATAKFLNNADVYELTSHIAEKTIELRRHYAIKLPDAVIAATALLYDLILVSRNTKDFSKIEPLEILNPFD